MQRRSLLASILTACAAPAIVRAGVLMPIATRQVWVPQPSALFTGELGRWDGGVVYDSSDWEQMRVDIIRFNPPRVFRSGDKLYLWSDYR